MKKYIKFTLIIVMGYLVSGCGGKAATSPKEFKQQVGDGGYFFKKEKFVVGKSHQFITNILKERSKTCLNRTVKSSGSMQNRQGITTSSYTAADKYISVVSKKKNGTQMYVRMHMSSSNMIEISKQHKDGNFIVVADIDKKTNSSSVVNFYYIDSSAYETINNTMRKWLKGKKTHCPKLN
ncbi:MAG: hypothetical protein DRG11_00275 [Epsilonproteobacteria bacterium]|nr:MAG: hypothetical protein DRG11_00275 [Campylobacterota bacterium]